MRNELSDRQQAIGLRLAGETIVTISHALQRCETWVRKWWHRYLKAGGEGLYELSRAHGAVVNRTFPRLFFSKLQVEVDRPGMGWRKGKKKGALPECSARIKKYAFEPHFAEFVDKSGIKLAEALEKAERYSENRWDNQGSPRI